jgi:hypothetical protein
LKKQSDWASRDVVLSAFFEDLAKEEPSLRHFNNHALFEDIINHRFQPGTSMTAATKVSVSWLSYPKHMPQSTRKW